MYVFTDVFAYENVSQKYKTGQLREGNIELAYLMEACKL